MSLSARSNRSRNATTTVSARGDRCPVDRVSASGSGNCFRRLWLTALAGLAVASVAELAIADVTAKSLRAGAAKVDITNNDAGPVHGRLFVKALVVEQGSTRLAMITVDAVAIGEIGPVGNDYLVDLRSQLAEQFHIPAANVLVNASHCHGIVCRDLRQRTVRAVKEAIARLEPVTVGVGVGHEDRIMVNRRVRLKSGRELDVRHAYAMPADESVADVGPIDPEIGVLRLDRPDGRTLAVVYNFACHPIQGVPGGGNTADMTGFASQVIEDNLSDGTIALFLQGCAGDINPVFYKSVDLPRDAEILGNRLGLSVLKAARAIECRPETRLQVLQSVLALPRADYDERIRAMEQERRKLVDSLGGTSLNLKTFMQLSVKHGLSPKYPSYYAHEYVREQKLGREFLKHLDDENRRNMAKYVRNIETMERITRVNTNLRLLRKHRDQALAAGRKTLDVELLGVRIGDFVLITFPGELTVQIGLNIKRRSPHERTFVAGYTNGYIYYAPTAEQLRNMGGAQEDSDCLLAPAWQALFEERVAQMLKRL